MRNDMRNRSTWERPRETQNGGRNEHSNPTKLNEIDTFLMGSLCVRDRMSQRKRILRALSRIGYPKANEFEGDSTANRSFLSWSGSAKISMKRMFFHRRS